MASEVRDDAARQEQGSNDLGNMVDRGSELVASRVVRHGENLRAIDVKAPLLVRVRALEVAPTSLISKALLARLIVTT